MTTARNPTGRAESTGASAARKVYEPRKGQSYTGFHPSPITWPRKACPDPAVSSGPMTLATQGGMTRAAQIQVGATTRPPRIALPCTTRNTARAKRVADCGSA